MPSLFKSYTTTLGRTAARDNSPPSFPSGGLRPSVATPPQSRAQAFANPLALAPVTRWQPSQYVTPFRPSQKSQWKRASTTAAPAQSH